MRKIRSWMMAALCGLLCLSLAACQSAPVASDDSASFPDALALMTAVWDAEESENKPKIFGGVGEDAASGVPGALNLEDASMLTSSLTVPEAVINASESGASAMNAMMANNFTASVWQIKDASKITDLAAEMSKTVETNHWMCGFPEEYQILQSGNFLILVYGLNDQVTPFVDACKQVCSNLEVLYSEPIA